MKSASFARLGALMALARRAAELRLAGLRADTIRAEVRRAELQATMAAPLGAEAFDQVGGLTAEIDWRRGLTGRIAAEERRIAELTTAAEAARAELRHAFGRERAAQRLVETVAAAEARQAARRAEDRVSPRRSGRA